VAIQLRKTASIWNSFSIDGSAMLIDEPMKGVRKELRQAIINAALLIASLFITPFVSLHLCGV
jgi:hypothetical protein